MPRRAWIVWIVLALLPLRSWAAISMALPADAFAPAAVVAAAALPPCHDAPEDTAAAATDCLLCQLCHSAVAGLPALPDTLATLPAEPPQARPADDTGRRLTGGLDRPPRI